MNSSKKKKYKIQISIFDFLSPHFFVIKISKDITAWVTG